MWQCIHHLFLAITPFIYIFNRYQGRTGQGGGGGSQAHSQTDKQAEKINGYQLFITYFL